MVLQSARYPVLVDGYSDTESNRQASAFLKWKGRAYQQKYSIFWERFFNASEASQTTF